MKRRLSALAIACAALTAFAQAPAQPALKPFAPFVPSANTQSVASKAALVERLRQGGLVVYFRHARTDWSTTDSDRSDLSRCATQRVLSDAGREQARAIGLAWRALRIPLSEVQASPFCRTLETAQLAFGGAAPVENLRHLFPEDERNFRTVGQRTWRLVDQATDKSGNRVLVGHGFNVRPLIGYDPGEGEAVVLRRRADGTVEDLGRITSEDFVQLAQPIASVAPGDVCGSAAVDRQQGVLVCRAVGPAHYWVARQTLPNPQMRDVPDGGPVPVDLLGRLQRGGLTLFMRHARTDWNQAATENPNQRAMYTDTLLAANCDAQRNLTDAGREEVVAAGRALRRLNVRISEVVTSPLCRTRETAGLLDAAAVRADNGLFDTFMFSGHSDTQVNARVLRSLLGTRPPTGHNMLLVGHALNLVQAMGGSLPAEGETLVFEPDGRGGARLVGSVHLSQWIRTN